MFLRPSAPNDHEAVLELARQAGFGMTSLPPDAEILRDKIALSAASFAGQVEAGHESFFFVLEDAESGRIAGTCGIAAHVGLSQPFYSYKLTTLTQTSKELGIYSKQSLLQICNDLTGASEIGSLFLAPDFRRDRVGKLLSFSRFMFIAAFPHLFDEQIIAEMRGVHDHEGNAPFYNSIARHFFQMPFAKADYTNATKGNQFINDLMPKYPIYVSLLPKSAQRVIGQPNFASEPAKAMLERQGFSFQGYVDVFDGGPTMQASRDKILTIKDSSVAELAVIDDRLEERRFLISNERFDRFRCLSARLAVQEDGRVAITPRAARELQVAVGDRLRYIAL